MSHSLRLGKFPSRVALMAMRFLAVFQQRLARLPIPGRCPSVLTLFVVILLPVAGFGQPLHEYFFANTLTGNGGGPALTQTLACGATAGAFSVQSISTNAGFCAIDDAFCFNDGGGLAYSNPSYITTSYSINVFFKFNMIGGWSRIIDFSNSTSDAGIYLLNDCLNFYPNGNVGSCPYFVANLWYLFTFVRNGTTGIISCYVNGTLFGSYNDFGTNLYRPATSTTPINFFRDDNTVPCEAQPGCVNYISITSAEMTPVQVNALWVTICSVILGNRAPELTAHCDGNGGAELAWEVGNAVEGDRFLLERSFDGNSWEVIDSAAVASAPGTAMAYRDAAAHATTYYRLKWVPSALAPQYSKTVAVTGCQSIRPQIFPNPAVGVVNLVLAADGLVEVVDLMGRQHLRTWMAAGEHRLSLAGMPAGTYMVRAGGTAMRLVVAGH